MFQDCKMAEKKKKFYKANAETSKPKKEATKQVKAKKTKSLDPSIPLLTKDPETWALWLEACSLFCQTTFKMIPYVVSDVAYPVREVPSMEMFADRRYAAIDEETKKELLKKKWVQYIKDEDTEKAEKIVFLGKIFQTISTESQNEIRVNEKWKEGDHDGLVALKILIMTHPSRTSMLKTKTAINVARK